MNTRVCMARGRAGRGGRRLGGPLAPLILATLVQLLALQRCCSLADPRQDAVDDDDDAARGKLSSIAASAVPPEDLGVGGTVEDADGYMHHFPTPFPTPPTPVPTPRPTPPTRSPTPSPTPPTRSPTPRLPDECVTIGGKTFCAPNQKSRTPFPTSPPTKYPTPAPTLRPTPPPSPAPTPLHQVTGAFVVYMRLELGGYTSAKHPLWHPRSTTVGVASKRFRDFDAAAADRLASALAQDWGVAHYDVRSEVEERTDQGIVVGLKVYAPSFMAARFVAQSARRVRMMLQMTLRSHGFHVGSTRTAGNFEFTGISIHERKAWEAKHRRSTGQESGTLNCDCDPFTETSTVTFCEQDPKGGSLKVTHELTGNPNEARPPGVAQARQFEELVGSKLRGHRCKLQWPSFQCKCCDCERGVADHPPPVSAPAPAPRLAAAPAPVTVPASAPVPAAAAGAAPPAAGYPPREDEAGAAAPPAHSMFYNPWLHVNSVSTPMDEWHKASDELPKSKAAPTQARNDAWLRRHGILP